MPLPAAGLAYSVKTQTQYITLLQTVKPELLLEFPEFYLS
jgi:hypothetical protein